MLELVQDAADTGKVRRAVPKEYSDFAKGCLHTIVNHIAD